MKIARATIWLTFLIAAATVHSQNPAPEPPKKIAVEFTCQCEDEAAASFATAFRDLLASSPRYFETYEPSKDPKTGKENYHFHIKAVSIDPATPPDGISTSISVVFLIGDTYYVGQVVQICGRDRSQGCAAAVLAQFDREINN
jgi:hypothetical protein